jgi:hypothetical protein
VAASQPNTIVAMVNPGAVLTPWSSAVQAVIAMFMPGQACAISSLFLSIFEHHFCFFHDDAP